MKEEKIKVLALLPMELPKEIELDNTLEAMQKFVGGLIECITSTPSTIQSVPFPTNTIIRKSGCLSDGMHSESCFLSPKNRRTDQIKRILKSHSTTGIAMVRPHRASYPS